MATSAAKLPANRNKNRYADILPCEQIPLISSTMAMFAVVFFVKPVCLCVAFVKLKYFTSKL